MLSWLSRLAHATYNCEVGGSNPPGSTKRRDKMNPYEESLLESQDLYCDICWRTISIREYFNNEGLCDGCAEEGEKV